MEEWLKAITVEPITETCRPKVKELAANLRPKDVEELTLTNTNLLLWTYNPDMRNYLICDGGKPVFLFGISKQPEFNNGHIIWCVCDKETYTKRRRAFVSLGNMIFRQWKRNYRTMWNTVLADNEKSIRWLSAMGAVFSRPQPYRGKQWRLFMIEGDKPP